MEVPSKPRALGEQAEADLRVQRRSDPGHHGRSRPAPPLGVQGGVRLPPAALLARAALGHRKSRLALEQVMYLAAAGKYLRLTRRPP